MAMIELAPHNKRGLPVATPLLAGSGAVGYGDLWPSEVDKSLFGALITAPVSLQPQRGSKQPRWVEAPAGFLLDTGDHNPGWRRLVASHAPLWRRSALPVILSLVGMHPGDRAWMAARVEEDGLAVAALELPVAENVNLGEVSASISAVRQVTTLPILVRLPATRAGYLAKACVVAGADALIVGTPPPASYPTPNGELLTAQIAGPLALPFTLRALQAVAALHLDVPLLAAGGIYRAQDAAWCFRLGASAVVLRSLFWQDPLAVQQLARTIVDEMMP